MNLRTLLLTCLVFYSCGLNLSANSAVWWEGEECTKTDFKSSDLLDKPEFPTRLSQMKWLNCYIPEDGDKSQKTFTAEYEINVPETSEYNFWTRELTRRDGSPWKFRFDGGKWIEVKEGQDFAEKTYKSLGKDKALAWYDLGKLNLTKGKHKFEIEISEKNGEKGFCSGFDCFLLTDVPFTPNGWQKPQVLSQYEYIGTYLWLEGEKAKNDFLNDMPDIPKKNSSLSEDQWLICAVDPERAPMNGFTAKWKFTIPLSGSYNIWLRCLTKALETPFEYRFVGVKSSGNWEKVSSSTPVFDNIELSKEASVCWVNLKTKIGKTYLREGENAIEIRVSEPNKNGNIKLAIDCICISLEPFTPQGKLKPDSEINPPEGWIAFRPENDLAKKEMNRISLRHLNEKESGSHGFCKVHPKKGLVFENGKKVKFWGINAYEPMKMDHDSVDTFVEKAASLGVNLIRVQGTLCNPDTRKFGEIDPDLYDKLCYFIKACKKNGIYVALANFNPSDYILNAKSGYAGYQQEASPYGLLYINPKFREIYKNWAKFLRRKNKYTNIRLYKDPTIIWFEIENGPGIFSEVFKTIPKQQKQLVEDIYNKWLIKKHGGFQEISHGWNIANKYHPVIKEDGLRSGKPCYRLLPPDSFEPNILNGRSTDFMNKRKSDQVKFLIQHCRKINKELIDYLRDECRFKGMISVGNSTVEAPDTLKPVRDYIYSSGDIIANTSVFDAKIQDNIPTLSSMIFFESRSALKNPLGSPVLNPMYPGKASVTTSVSWPLPNRYRAEAVPFIAAYSSLHGSDVYLWYNADSPSWSSRLKKYSIQDPAIMGEFPAAALMFRRGDISPGAALVKKRIGLDDIIDLKGDGFSNSKYRDKIYLSSVEVEEGETNPLASIAGKVEHVFDEKKTAYMKNSDLSKYYNLKKSQVKSTNDELKLDFKNGYLTINTPKSQGVTGFFSIDILRKLKDITVGMENSYGTVLVTSLDDTDIAKSKHILIQCFTEESNYNWKTSPVPGKKFMRIDNVGDSPLIIKAINGSVSFPKINNKGWEIWKLDINGKRTSQLENLDTEYLNIPLTSDTIHIELIKK